MITFNDILKQLHDCKPPVIEVDAASHAGLLEAVKYNHEYCDMKDGVLYICNVAILVERPELEVTTEQFIDAINEAVDASMKDTRTPEQKEDFKRRMHAVINQEIRS